MQTANMSGYLNSRRARSAGRRRRYARRGDGFSVVELLVTITVLGVIVSLLLPAVQAAREAVRKAQCKNNLKQIGLAFQLHHDIHGHYPSDGWGWRWMGDARRGFASDQPGGWCFNVLPFIEHGAVRDLALGGQSSAQVLATPLETLYCPSRRRAANFPFTASMYPLHNSDAVTEAAKTDFAVCAGDRVISTPAGPESGMPEDVKTYSWPPSQKATGISYVRTQISSGQILDGTSNTAMVGEKYIARICVALGNDKGDDQSAFIGDDADIRRWTDMIPKRDSTEEDLEHFGSAHGTGCHFVLCDGSIRYIGYNVDSKIFRSLGNRQDGVVIDWGE